MRATVYFSAPSPAGEFRISAGRGWLGKIRAFDLLIQSQQVAPAELESSLARLAILLKTS
jgi:hypothetical protein